MRFRAPIPLRPSVRRMFLPLGAAALALAMAVPAQAQLSVEQRAGNLAVNGALGGVTGAVRAAIKHRPVGPAFVRGAAGGVLWGAGKQLTVARIPAPGLVARQVSAVGVSLIGSAERDTITLVFPFSVVSVEWTPQARRPPRARANLWNVGYLVWKLAEGNEFDLSSTLATGAPVLGHPGLIGAERFDGIEGNGVIVLNVELSEYSRTREMLPHETVHLLQEDAVSILTIPVERAALSRFSRLRGPLRYVDAGVLMPLAYLIANHVVPYDNRPWEVEAYLVTTGQRGRGVVGSPP